MPTSENLKIASFALVKYREKMTGSCQEMWNLVEQCMEDLKSDKNSCMAAREVGDAIKRIAAEIENADELKNRINKALEEADSI